MLGILPLASLSLLWRLVLRPSLPVGLNRQSVSCCPENIATVNCCALTIAVPASPPVRAPTNPSWDPAPTRHGKNRSRSCQSLFPPHLKWSLVLVPKEAEKVSTEMACPLFSTSETWICIAEPGWTVYSYHGSLLPNRAIRLRRLLLSRSRGYHRKSRIETVQASTVLTARPLESHSNDPDESRVN